MASKLNIPKKTDNGKFNSVDFVEGMSTFQMKTFIKNMWENMGELANVMETHGRNDVADVIDRMREGHSWSSKQLRDRFRFTRHGTTIIVYDLVNDTFRLLDESGHSITYNAVHQQELTNNIKKTLNV